MTTNINRCGNATSSEIVALTTTGSRDMTEEELQEYKKENPKGRKKTIESGFGEPAFTYIEEINMERLLGRSLEDEKKANAMKWGNLLEPWVFDGLGPEYTYSSDQTVLHPVIPGWAGSPDGTIEEAIRAVYDMKCPFTLKSFCQLVQPIYDGLKGIDAMNAIRNGYTDSRGLFHKKHKDGEKYYWQLVSNAILKDTPDAALIVSMPYESELADIKQMVDGNPDAYFIAMAGPDELPFLKDGGYYMNRNIIRFEIPKEDKDFLTSRVLEAGKYLIPFFCSAETKIS